MSFSDGAITLLAFASPLVLVGLFIALFSRRVRGTAVAALILGCSGTLLSVGSGKNHIGGLWGWSSPAPDMGALWQFFAHAAASFSLGALVTVIFVLGSRALGHLVPIRAKPSDAKPAYPSEPDVR
jgi:hypothetical protein